LNLRSFIVETTILLYMSLGLDIAQDLGKAQYESVVCLQLHYLYICAYLSLSLCIVHLPIASSLGIQNQTMRLLVTRLNVALKRLNLADSHRIRYYVSLCSIFHSRLCRHHIPNHCVREPHTWIDRTTFCILDWHDSQYGKDSGCC
jgi:hypothetical protein